jgi:Protein of unknown function (DUF2934)
MKKTSSPTSTQPYKQQSRPQGTDGDMQARIRQRAYELYEERGRGDGRHEEDWALAEKQNPQGAQLQQGRVMIRPRG